MPEHDRTRLGSRQVRLDRDVVRFRPTRLQAWRGIAPVDIAYHQVLSLVMNDPDGFSRGELTVRLTTGECFVMHFGSDRLATMRRLYRDFWRRVQEAHGEEPDTVT